MRNALQNYVQHQLNALEIYVERSTNLYGSITSHPSIPSSESWNLARIYEHSLSRNSDKKNT